MSWAVDSHTFCVYAAEQSLSSGSVFHGPAEAEGYLTELPLNEWWAEHYGDEPRPHIKITHGADAPRQAGKGVWDGGENDGTLRSWALSTWDETRDVPSWQIRLHEQMANELVLLHEVAHCLMPTLDGDLATMRRQWRRHRLPNPATYHAHGAMFTAVLTSLVTRYGSKADHRELTMAYRHFAVPVATAAELQEACHGDLERQRFLHQVQAEIRQRWAAQDGAECADRSQPLSGQAPPLSFEATAELMKPRWGDWLFLGRHHFPGRAPGRDRMARAISVVEKCSRRDLETIERLTERPDDLHLLRVSLCAVAWLGIDPVWARTSHGLVRWACDLELEDLRRINPDWVDWIERLNEMLQTRPARWSVDGER